MNLRTLLYAVILVILVVSPLSADDALGFLPKEADAVFVLRPARLLELSTASAGETGDRFQKILAEMARRTGVDFGRDLQFGGIYLLGLEGFLAGSRPRAVLFARGKINQTDVVNAAGIKATRVDEFDTYPLGDGVVFAFSARDTLLFGGLNEVLPGLMAARKPLLSGRENHRDVEEFLKQDEGICSLSLRFDDAARQSLAGLLPEGVNPEITTGVLQGLYLGYDRETGMELRLTTVSNDAAARLQPLLGKTLEAGAARVAEELERYRGETKAQTDEAALRTLKGMELSHALLSGMESKVQGPRIHLRVAGEKIRSLSEALLLFALRIVNRNYSQARGEDGVRRCLANMKILEGAAELAFLDGKAPARKAIAMEQLVSWNYLRQLPVCPQQGTYSLKAEENGFEVKCSIHGEMQKIYDRLYNPAEVR